ncbi:hypothetical protein D3C84_406820 [compost metagenome]
MQRLLVQRDVGLAVTHLSQLAVGMTGDVALQQGNQCRYIEGGLFTGHRVLLQSSLCLGGIGQQDGLDVPLVLATDVQASTQRCKCREGDGRLQAEVALAVLAVNAGAITHFALAGFVLFKVVQRRFQQRGLANTTGPGVDAENELARHFKVYGELVEVLDRGELRLQSRFEQRFGEGIDVVLQVAQGLIQHALQTPALIHQLLEVLTVDLPRAAIPLGHLRLERQQGLQSLHRRIFDGAGDHVFCTTVMYPVTIDGHSVRYFL